MSPPPITDPLPDRLLAYLGNGYIGLRVGRIPWLNGLAIVNGFWGPHPKDLIPAVATAPFPLGGDLVVNGIRASESPDAVQFVSQQMDFATGELTSRFTFRADAVTVETDVVTFCSRVDPALVFQEVTVRADHDADVVLTASIETAGVPGRWLDGGAIPHGEPPTAQAWLAWASVGGMSGCGAVIAADSEPSFERAVNVDEAAGRVAVSFTGRVQDQRPAAVRSIVGL